MIYSIYMSNGDTYYTEDDLDFDKMSKERWLRITEVSGTIRYINIAQIMCVACGKAKCADQDLELLPTIFGDV